MDRDLDFFRLAEKPPFLFKSTKHFDRRMTPMFEVDEGPEEIRSTVHYYTIQRKLE